MVAKAAEASAVRLTVRPAADESFFLAAVVVVVVVVEHASRMSSPSLSMIDLPVALSAVMILVPAAHDEAIIAA